MCHRRKVISRSRFYSCSGYGARDYSASYFGMFLPAPSKIKVSSSVALIIILQVQYFTKKGKLINKEPNPCPNRAVKIQGRTGNTGQVGDVSQGKRRVNTQESLFPAVGDQEVNIRSKTFNSFELKKTHVMRRYSIIIVWCNAGYSTLQNHNLGCGFKTELQDPQTPEGCSKLVLLRGGKNTGKKRLRNTGHFQQAAPSTNTHLISRETALEETSSDCKDHVIFFIN